MSFYIFYGAAVIVEIIGLLAAGLPQVRMKCSA